MAHFIEVTWVLINEEIRMQSCEIARINEEMQMKLRTGSRRRGRGRRRPG